VHSQQATLSIAAKRPFPTLNLPSTFLDPSLSHALLLSLSFGFLFSLQVYSPAVNRSLSKPLLVRYSDSTIVFAFLDFLHIGLPSQLRYSTISMSGYLSYTRHAVLFRAGPASFFATGGNLSKSVRLSVPIRLSKFEFIYGLDYVRAMRVLVHAPLPLRQATSQPLTQSHIHHIFPISNQSPFPSRVEQSTNSSGLGPFDRLHRILLALCALMIQVCVSCFLVAEQRLTPPTGAFPTSVSLTRLL